MGVLDLEVPPPSLEAMVVHAASCLLPHYVPAMTGPLRRQPLVHKALQLTQLVQDTGAAEGRSPWVGAGGIVQKRRLMIRRTSVDVHVRVHATCRKE